MNDPTNAPANVLDEFEREPVPERSLKGLKSFLGIYAGEHVAGTEFMIGSLFLAAGVSAMDLILGLILGNLLAVLSWLFICAPIAAKLRLTLYYKLEKICGVKLVTLYNLANGVLFCFLAGAMVTVSSTALGVPFNLKMPGLNEWLPNSVAWVIVVIGVGAVFSLVAARGYDAMVKVANIVVPWMVLVFLACGVAALTKLGVHSAGDFWTVAKEKIWTGGPPLTGVKFTFWHVLFFAWFCNAAVHIGMADMSILRYARKWHYGASTAAGMFIGHFLAWISASLLYAVQLAQAGWHPPMRPPPIAPGPMAYDAVGIAGLGCVMMAGWTTANPTIYRAGLAFQTLLPRSSRFTVTLIAGGIATCGAIFPGLVMLLLDFVALYGLVLMPMGAVIFVDFWLLQKFGLEPDYAARTGISINWAAGLAWFLTLSMCLVLNKAFGMQIYFLALPGWLMAGVFYLAFSKWYQSKRVQPAVACASLK